MKRYFSMQKTLLLCGLLLALTFISACNDDDDPAIAPDVAGFMAFNLASDQPPIGIALSGNTLHSPLPYMSYTGGYVAIYPGERSTDAFDFNSGNTIATATYTYEPQNYYSLFVIGTNGNYQNVIVNDGLDTLNASKDKAYIRYINAIPGSGMPLVIIKNESDTLMSSEISYGEISDFQPVTAGNITISINNGAKVNTSRSIDVEDQKAYTLLFAGNTEGDQPSDSIQIRYVENGTLTLDSTSEDLSKTSN